MHFVIPILVFVTANLWGLFNTIPFTNIDPARSFWDRALGSVQLASTVYTLDQLPRIVDEGTWFDLLKKEYFVGWSTTILPEMEPATIPHPGPIPTLAPLTSPHGLSSSPSSPTSSTPTITGPPCADTHAQACGDPLVEYLVYAILALVVWLVVKQIDQTRDLAMVADQISHLQAWQGSLWDGIVDNHSNLVYLVNAAHAMQQAAQKPLPVVEVLDVHSQQSAPSDEKSSAAVDLALHEVLASLDTLRQTIDRGTDVWEGFWERLEVNQSGSSETHPTDFSVGDPMEI
ncbi:hypothetical protein POX_b02558 [Penicillium oxalicum]|uniref:hypothetical protein n=1 Tax=Penicillium oxalicum TaxID=69781 RepID=UPI0020B645D4|nr:hypothetical protein POX_b02558 [Penicillium oxalicum]KAI2792520.1 hypothetical protein POX_b02558 [Penicillium oxalicum]